MFSTNSIFLGPKNQDTIIKNIKKINSIFVFESIFFLK